MKKLFIMALAAIFAANISAQEVQAGKAECKKENKECKQSFEERTEKEIQFLSNELYLDSVQAAKFAKTYREYKKAQFELKKEFRKKFAKSLNERQIEAVLRFPAPKHQCKGDCGHKGKGECAHDGKGECPHKGHKHHRD